MKNLLLILSLLFISINLLAQTENVVFTLHLKNGDVISGNSDVSQIDFKTTYGNLNIPIGEVNTIKIGLQNSNFDKLRLLDLLEKLDVGKDKEKENAFDEIVKMNEGAIPFIKTYLNNSKTNSSSDMNVGVLYEVMLAKYKISKNFNLYDELFYNGKNTVEGTWAFQNLMLETSYGRIKVDRRNIESIDVKIMPTSGFSKDNSFKVFANKYVIGNQDEGWLNTGILVKKGEEIIISASGEISLASLSGNKYTADGGVNGSPGPTDKKLNYGNLVFKIGQNGEPKKAGDNISFIADKTGIIYLSIYETVFNSANLGFYNVNVKLK